MLPTIYLPNFSAAEPGKTDRAKSLVLALLQAINPGSNMSEVKRQPDQFFSLLGLDPMTSLDLMRGIGKICCIEIPVEDWSKFGTLNQAVDYVLTHMQVQAKVNRQILKPARTALHGRERARSTLRHRS